MGMISSFYKIGKLKKKSKPAKSHLGTSKSTKKLPIITNSNVVVPKSLTKARNKFSNKLNENLPKSEIWFQELYDNYRDKGDFFNKPLGNYIPDVSNYRYKYVIEIAGSMHNLDHIKAHDAIKNHYYKEHGYRVIRVRAYSERDFTKLVRILNIITKRVLNKNVPKFESQLEIDEYMSADIS